MRIIKLEDLEIEYVARILNEGGLIVYPTETVYGLGADATSEAALEKLWAFKGERGDKPVLVAVADLAMAEKYVNLTNLGRKIAQKYWPGPVAIVASSKNEVAKKAQGQTETLGLRNPDNKVMLEVIRTLGKPITSTSANISGGLTARSLSEFLATMPEDRQKLIDLFIDAGELPKNLPSTIVDTTEEKIKILRQGGTEVLV